MKTANEQVQEFCTTCNIEILKNKIGTYKYFLNDDEPRDVYRVRIQRKNDLRRYISFTFGNSLASTRENGTISNYDILAGLYTQFGDTYQDFVGCFGEESSGYFRKTVILNEKIEKFFTKEELELLTEIN